MLNQLISRLHSQLLCLTNLAHFFGLFSKKKWHSKTSFELNNFNSSSDIFRMGYDTILYLLLGMIITLVLTAFKKIGLPLTFSILFTLSAGKKLYDHFFILVLASTLAIKSSSALPTKINYKPALLGQMACHQR